MWPQILMVPISPSIGLKEGDRIALTPHTVLGADTSAPYISIAGFTVQDSGKLNLFNAGEGLPPLDPTNEWIIGYPDSVYAEDYECQVTEISQFGTALRTGTVGASWIDCGLPDSNRQWSIENSGPVDADWVLRLKIRNQSSQIEYANEIITLDTQNVI